MWWGLIGVVGSICLLVGTANGAIDPEARDGNFLLEMCTANIKDQDKVRLKPDEQLYSIWCLGYVFGFLAGHEATVVKNRMKSPPVAAQVFCLPQISHPRNQDTSAITSQQTVRIVMKYLRTYPELLHLPLEVLILGAFQEAFPCSLTTQPIPSSGPKAKPR